MPTDSNAVVLNSKTFDHIPLITRRSFDAKGRIEYLGESAPGSASSASVWRITKHSYTNGRNVSTLYADGNSNFDNVWNDRTSLSYS